MRRARPRGELPVASPTAAQVPIYYGQTGARLGNSSVSPLRASLAVGGGGRSPQSWATVTSPKRAPKAARSAVVSGESTRMISSRVPAGTW
jgi:hypothetical protein